VCIFGFWNPSVVHVTHSHGVAQFLSPGSQDVQQQVALVLALAGPHLLLLLQGGHLGGVHLAAVFVHVARVLEGPLAEGALVQILAGVRGSVLLKASAALELLAAVRALVVLLRMMVPDVRRQLRPRALLQAALLALPLPQRGGVQVHIHVLSQTVLVGQPHLALLALHLRQLGALAVHGALVHQQVLLRLELGAAGVADEGYEGRVMGTSHVQPQIDGGAKAIGE